ncbi:MAG: ABC transporter ATP-binding protein [Candidatus Lokiarchaeota archaeon]|nr:ABC transporter ATP-binding protein [Candidatus Harpocratesius repetitus]
MTLQDDLNKNKEPFVRFEHVTKKFGNFTAVSNISFEIFRGEVLGFLGPNGAGKSTTMKMLARLLRPTEGTIFIRANDHLAPLTNQSKDILLNNVGFLIENPTFYGNMTPREILSYFAELKGYPHNKVKKRVEEVVEMVELSDWIDVKMKGFSKGMRQKIGIMSAIVHDPDIVILDEPHTGLDPRARAEIRTLILKLKEMGKTIFLSSHLLYEVSEVADRVAIISNGKIIALDTLENLEQRAQGSIIELELYKLNSYSDDEIANRIAQLNQIVEPLTGLAPEENSIRFNPNSKQIEILFNGNPENQLKIFQALFKANFQVLEFSVPKAGLLEDLYLKFMDEEDSNQKALIQANQNIASNSKSKTKTKAKTKTKTKTPGVKV